MSMYKPRLLLSSCFAEATRYDGGRIQDATVERLKPWIEPIYFCPEVSLGLGIPRPRIIIKRVGSERRLIQPDTGRDLTKEMKRLLEDFLSNLPEIDGALLKSKSPSCGVNSAKEYKNQNMVRKADGFLAEALRNRDPYLPLEDEGRLRDKSIYYQFLTRIFALAEFRERMKEESPFALIEFHTDFKYILKTYHEKFLIDLGRLVASNHLSLSEKLSLYGKLFRRALANKPSRARHANTLYHLAGYFTRKMNPKEKNHILQLIERYRQGRLELRTLLELLKSLALRFEESYILRQRYLNPFPEELF